MRKWVWAAVVLAVGAAQPGWAAKKSRSNCYSEAAIEAEQAIRYITDLMVASSACRKPIYAEFAYRNRDQIIRYQKAMISHLHGTKAFDTWNTVLANQSAMRQAAVPTEQFCHQAETLMKQAAALDIKAFRALAEAQAAAAEAQYTKCGGKKKKK